MSKLHLRPRLATSTMPVRDGWNLPVISSIKNAILSIALCRVILAIMEIHQSET